MVQMSVEYELDVFPEQQVQVIESYNSYGMMHIRRVGLNKFSGSR